MYKPLRTLVSSAVLSIMATNVAHSAGFSLYGEGNGAAAGNYGAGLAAEAADASIGWYNPAGLVLINEQQAVFGGVGIFPSSKLSGTSNFVTPNPFGSGNLVYTQTFDNIESAENAFVPSFHYALPLTDRAVFGFSVTSPFGLATDWGPYSPVRYEATYTEVITTNFSPELGVKVAENFSFGAGLDIQYARVKFNSMVGLPTVLTSPFLRLPATTDDTLSYNKGSSYGVGFHAGLMGMFNDNHTRIGLNYQSKIRHTFYGYSNFIGPLAGNPIITPFQADGFVTSNDLYSNPIQLPDVLTLSAYQDVNEKLALLGSVVYTGWNVFQTIQLNNIAAPAISTDGDVTQIQANLISPQNYKNVWRVALGANYHINNQLMLRVGGGYDQSPTNDINRDVRLPDTDRWALAVGARYQPRPNISVDAGYTRLFGIQNNGVHRTDHLATSTYTVDASASSSANLVGLQLNWTIDHVEPAPTK